MTNVFTFKGQPRSSTLPTITLPQRDVEVFEGKVEQQPVIEVPRHVFWDIIIQGASTASPITNGTPVYIATGGGYGSYQGLIGWEKEAGLITREIPSISGKQFLNLHPFKLEADQVRLEIERQIGPELLAARPEAVEQTLSAFYSDEANTRLAKGLVNALLKQGKSCIYESASVYEDTITRAQLARAHGMKTVLIAGDQDIEKALAAKTGNVEPANIARSYKKFAARFETELVPLFDEIRVYNTDGPTPLLIAMKPGAQQALKVYDERCYAEFKAKQDVDPDVYQTPTAGMNAIHDEWLSRERPPSPGRPVLPSGSSPAPQVK